MQSELNKALWRACNVARGSIEAADFKNYLLALLFLKYLSDADHPQASFHLPKHCDFPHLYRNRNHPTIGAMVNQALAEIAGANGGRLEGVFTNIDFDNEARLGGPKERQRLVKGMLEGFNPLDLSPSRVGNLDVVGNAYEYLLGRFAADSGRMAGEYYTPPEVAELMVQLVQPLSGESICDPACGSGSLLIRCGRHVGKERPVQLYGQEITPTTWALARMNMMLHDFEESDIRQGDTLRGPKLLDCKRQLLKFDVVVANPPFSIKDWGRDCLQPDPFGRFKRGLPPKRNGDFAFISHVVEALKPRTGRAAVVVPNGVLFRDGAEKNIRAAFIKEGLIHTVIRLPENLFFGTSIAASILIIKPSRDGTLFIDAEEMYRNRRKQNVLDQNAIGKITSLYQSRQTENGVAFLADQATVEGADYHLTVNRYVEPVKEASVVDLNEAFKAMIAMEEAAFKTTAKMKRIMKRKGLWQ